MLINLIKTGGRLSLLFVKKQWSLITARIGGYFGLFCGLECSCFCLFGHDYGGALSAVDVL